MRSLAIAAFALTGLTLCAGRAAADVWKSVVCGPAEAVSFSFLNDLPGPIDIYWIDYNGNKVAYASGLANGRSYKVTTTCTTHPWLVAYQGRPYMIYRGDTRTGQVILVGTEAIGTLTSPGEVVFQPVTAYQEFAFTDPAQTAVLSMVVKSRLVYGADRQKYLHLDLDGSIVSAGRDAIGSDTQLDKGWFLDSVTTTLRSVTGDLQLSKAADISGGGETGSITSSTSTTLNFSGNAKVGANDKGPSGELGGQIGYSQTVGASYTRTLKGFTPQAPAVKEDPTGEVQVENDYKLSGILFDGDGGLKPYSEPKSLVNLGMSDDFWGGVGAFFSTAAWSGFKLHGLPSLSKKGLPLVSQAILIPRTPSFNGRAMMLVSIAATMRRTYVTGNTKLDAKWHTQSQTRAVSRNFIVDFGFNYPSADNVAPYMR